MSYNIKNALADFKKEDLADGMIDILKDSTRTLEKTKENGFLKLSLKNALLTKKVNVETFIEILNEYVTQNRESTDITMKKII